MNWLISLKNRTKTEVGPENTAFGKAWCVFMPLIAYYLVDTIVVKLCAMFVKRMAEDSAAFALFCENNSSIMSVIIKIIAMLCGICPLLPMFMREKPAVIYKDAPKKRYVFVALAGISVSFFLNLLFSVTGFTGSSEQYSEVSQRQFSLPLLLGIFLYGIFTPLVEEVLFRGIVYNRLRRNYNLCMALIGSSLLFGFYHGNIVQAVYGALMGLLLAWVYERYGGFVYPVIVHSIANTWIYLCMSLPLLKNNIMNAFVLALTGIVALLAVILIGRDKQGEE